MKSQNTILRRRRAVSPVIATVIIVAVTITVAVAVSYWISGISSQYTSFEKVEIKSAYASRKDDGDGGLPEVFTFKGWVIKIGVQNTGSQTSTLESVYVNNKPLDEYGLIESGGLAKIRWTETEATVGSDWDTWSLLADVGVSSVSMESGDETTIYVLIYGEAEKASPDEYDGLFSAGTTINIQFHSASGMDYIKLVQLN